MTGWRVGVDLRAAEAPLTAARLLLIADLLARVAAELRGEEPTLAVLDADGSRAQSALCSQTRSLAKVLGIREPLAWTHSTEQALRFLGVGPAVWIVSAGRGLTAAATETLPLPFAVGALPGPADAGPTPARARSAPRRFSVGSVSVPAHAGAALADLRAHEPLAIRLALLRFLYRQPAVLSTARLHRAEETLLRWRFRVAGWFDLPPAPAPPATMQVVRDALVGDLDTAAVLVALHRLEVDPTVPSGSKFDAFDQADRVLGLDLRHSVHRLR